MRRSLNPILVKNTSDETVPSFGIMVMSGAERTDRNDIVIKVEKLAIPPTIEGRQVLLVNSARELSPSGDDQYGWARMAEGPPGWVAYDSTDGTPAFGQMWGVENDNWKLAKDGAGFMIVGPVESSKKRVLAAFSIDQKYYFTLDEALTAPSGNINAGATPTTATASLYTGSSSGTLTKISTVELTNRWDELELGNDKSGYCVWDWNILEWVIVTTECP